MTRLSKMDIQMILIIASGLTTIGLGVNAHLDARRSDKDSREKQAELRQTNASLGNSRDEFAMLQRRHQEELKIKTDSITFLQNRLVTKSEQVLHAQTEGMNQLLGTESFCRMYLSNFSQNDFIISVIQEGKYNVYDLKIRAVDVNESAKFETRQFADIGKYTKIYDVGSLGPKQSVPVDGPATPEPYTEKRYNFFFSARSGVWVQQYILRIKGNKLFQATKVYKTDSRQILYKNIQDGFLNEKESEHGIWQKEATGTLMFGR
jgi:hypothetical protein